MKRGWPNLPFDAWPDGDRRAWEALLREGDVLDGQGAGAHWSEETQRTNLKHYAGWLGWLDQVGQLDPIVTPADRVTPSQVDAYTRALMSAVAPATVSSYLRDLKVVVKAMAPERDWHWLMELTNRLKSWAGHDRDDRLLAPPAPEMFRAILQELEQRRGAGFATRHRQLAYRDRLLVGVLLSAPIRLRNLAMIEIGVHLKRRDDSWHLTFDAVETKTHQSLHLVLAPELTLHVGTYLTEVRPHLPGAAASSRLWMACKGKPMAHHSIYDRVRQTTRTLFGVALTPHDFRAVAATLLAETSPEDALRARPLLGHRQLATTEAHYIKARQIEAARKVAESIREIRNAGHGRRFETGACRRVIYAICGA